MSIDKLFVTGVETIGGIQHLSGIILEPATSAEYRAGVFNAFLVSDRTRQIQCEKPRVHGGFGTNPDGLMVGEFDSELFGLNQYLWVRGAVNLDIAENRFRIIAVGDLSNVAFPAFLASKPPLAPGQIGVILATEIKSLRDLPTIQAFAVRHPMILEAANVQKPFHVGLVLPVVCMDDRKGLPAALVISKQLTENLCEATMYFEGSPPQVDRECVIEMHASRADPCRKGERSEFRATVGSVAEIL